MNTSGNESIPKVSVVMNCRNAAAFLVEAIDSVYGQTFKDWEIVFWDNMSTDGSAAIAERYDEHLRYFKGEEFLPLGAARNLAIARCKGELIAFLDCDDLWVPEKLERQLECIHECPDAALVFSDGYVIDERGDTIDQLSNHFDFRSYDTAAFEGFRALLEHGCFIDLGSVLVRKSVLDEVGGVDSGYTHVEDYDLWLRIAREYRLAYVDAPLAKWRRHAGQWTQRYRGAGYREHVHLLSRILEDEALDAELKSIVKTRMWQRSVSHGIHSLQRAKLVQALAPLRCFFRFPGHALRHVFRR